MMSRDESVASVGSVTVRRRPNEARWLAVLSQKYGHCDKSISNYNLFKCRVIVWWRYGYAVLLSETTICHN